MSTEAEQQDQAGARRDAIRMLIDAFASDYGCGPALTAADAVAALETLGVADSEIDDAISDDRFLQQWKTVWLPLGERERLRRGR